MSRLNGYKIPASYSLELSLHQIGQTIGSFTVGQEMFVDCRKFQFEIRENIMSAKISCPTVLNTPCI